MLSELSKEQVVLMDVVKEEWLNRFFSLEFDECKAKELMSFLYSFTDFTPEFMLVLDSPLALQFACNWLKGSQVKSQVESQVKSQVESQVGSQVRSQVKSQVGSQVRSQVKSQVWSQVRSQVRSQVWSQVKSQVWSQVWSQKLSYFYESDYGKCDDFGWISFYDFFERIGIVKNKNFKKFKNLVKCDLFTSIIQDRYCVICKPPVFINRDENNNLHCVNDYAIAFADGYGQHFVNGVFFSPELFNKFFKRNGWSGEDVMKLENTEQKAVLIKHFGYERIINDLKDVKVIDVWKEKSFVDGKPVKYELFEFSLDNLVCRVVSVECHSVHKKTFLGVPRSEETNTCKKAVAWTFGLKAKDYDLEVQT